MLKKEQRQAVLGLLEQKPDWLLPFYHDFWENFNLPLVRGSETQTKRKECSISCIAIADVINDQVEAMDFKTILYQNINYLLNCNYQLSTLCRVMHTFSPSPAPRVFIIDVFRFPFACCKFII